MVNHNAKIAIFDIETAPAEAYIWNRWQQNIRSASIISEGYVFCAVAKFIDETHVRKRGLLDSPERWASDQEDDYDVVKFCWDILDQADIVVAHNAKKFDIPVVNTRFIAHGMKPPSPYKVVDTLQIVKRKFKFPYNGLQDVLTYLGMAGKHETSFQLWKDCKKGKKKAWRDMVKYCVNDVLILEDLYIKLLPWMDTHPNIGLYTNMERPACTKCGCTKLHRKGTYKTMTQVYQRYRCTSCGASARERCTSLEKEKRKNVLTNTAM